MTANARAIYQQLLDTLSQAIMTQDETMWKQHIHLPHFMTTCDGKLVLESQADLDFSLQDYCQALHKLKITRLERTCDTARYINGEVIVGFHTTKMLTADGTAYPTYPVRWVMQLESGVWKVAKSDSALSAADWDNIPHNNLSQFDHVGGSATKARRMLLQNVMDRIDAVYMSGDFEGWRDSVCLPLVFETRSGTGIFETEDALRRDFDLYQQEFRIHQISELTRVVKSAELIDDDMMLGTYRVHVLSGSHYVVPPWDGAMTLKQVDGRWRVTKLMGALGHLNWNSNAGRQTETPSALPPTLN